MALFFGGLCLFAMDGVVPPSKPDPLAGSLATETGR